MIAPKRMLLGLAIGALAAGTIGAFVFAQGVNDYSPSLEGYTRTGDPRQIVVTAIVGLGDEVSGKSVSEGDAKVVISLRVRQPPTDKPAVGIRIPVAVTLKSPLGARIVVDGGGRVLPEQH